MNTSITFNSSSSVARKQTITKLLEFSFFFYLIYSNISTPLGIFIPYLAGVMLTFLVMISILIIKWKRSTIIPLILIICVAITFWIMQILVFETPLSYTYMRSFLDWVVSAFIILSLSEQHGFITRLAIAMFLIALILLPFVRPVSDIIERQTVETGTNLENANTWAAWLGFCMLVFWLWGWKQRNIIKKTLLWILAFATAILMMKTVSRGAMLALLVGILAGFRGIPWKKWIYILILLLVFYFFSALMFPSLFSNYLIRLNEETGRGIVWPIAFQAILHNPFLGYGLFKIVQHIIVPITPHNGLLLIWLASGAFPALLFIWLWTAAIIRSMNARWMIARYIDSFPLIIYSFLMMNLSNVSHFMSFWALAAIFYCFLDNPLKNMHQNQNKYIE